MSIILGKTIHKYNLNITSIKVDNIDYEYIYNMISGIKYCKSEHQLKTIMDKINIHLSNINTDKSIDNITNIIINCTKNLNKMNIKLIDDKYNMFNNNKFTKYKLNYSDIYNKFFNSNNIKNFNNKIINQNNKELFLNEKQFYNMIMSEINKVNSNTEYHHYIVCNNDDITDINIRFVYTNGELGTKMVEFNDKYGYNYFEINMKLSRMYPFVPPTIKYNKPKINISLLSSIYNMELWDYNVWNYSITLNYIISTLGNILEPLFNKHIDINNELFDFIDLKMVELNSISKTCCLELIPINIPITKPDVQTNKLYWKAGTGFGSDNASKWDISKYIDINKNNNIKISNIFSELNTHIKQNPNNPISSNLYEYIQSKFIDINLLNINNNIDIYKLIIESLSLLNDNNFMINIVKLTKDIISEIKMIITNQQLANSIDENILSLYLYFIDIIDKYNNSIKIDKSENKVNTNVYEQLFSEQAYDEFELTPEHRFYDKRNDLITPKTILRIMTELSSLKKDLPINWDSSVAIRICSTNANMITFIIAGPKDTPYHNGLFEFHAYFPDNYPKAVPSVLLNTTDNGRVRFNPNLYANGKVCLSLLGTWSGEKGESWVPEISTFFQVIISIQSLILVDEPYFNEPGYERLSNTPQGIKHSFTYNDKIRLETVKVAMIKILENPPEDYKELIINHFKLKKNEIINIVQIWVNESNNKDEFNKYFDILKNILINL
jgi:ubiquitin-protein ligase